MIFAMTVHWNDASWVETQLTSFARYLGPQPFKVLLGVSPGLDLPDLSACLPLSSIDIHTVSASHSANLDSLAASARSMASPEDVLVFIDGDAILTAEIESSLADLEKHVLVAVQRVENGGDLQPHPLFCAVRAGWWYAKGATWAEGPTSPGRRGRSDVGGALLQLLSLSHERWKPLHLSASLLGHQLWSVEYGSRVYHHGAAFREPWSTLNYAEVYGTGLLSTPRRVVDGLLYRVPRLRQFSRRRGKEIANAELLRGVESYRSAGVGRLVEAISMCPVAANEE